jgi:hypothetical protein
VTFRDELTQATRRVYERYAVEVVERFNFCPWARAARESHEVLVRVVFSEDLDDFSESLVALSELHAAPSDVVIALFIYPLLDLDRRAFEDFVRRLRTRAENPQVGLDEFAMAAFHPAAQADLTHPDRLVPYVRRSPDPTLQLVRNSTLSSIKGLSQGTAFLDVSTLSAELLSELTAPAPKPVRERIGEQNLETVLAQGTAAIDQVLADIAQEREAAHVELEQRFGKRGPRRTIPG